MATTFYETKSSRPQASILEGSVPNDEIALPPPLSLGIQYRGLRSAQSSREQATSTLTSAPTRELDNDSALPPSWSQARASRLRQSEMSGAASFRTNSLNSFSGTIRRTSTGSDIKPNRISKYAPSFVSTASSRTSRVSSYYPPHSDNDFDVQRTDDDALEVVLEDVVPAQAITVPTIGVEEHWHTAEEEEDHEPKAEVNVADSLTLSFQIENDVLQTELSLEQGLVRQLKNQVLELENKLNLSRNTISRMQGVLEAQKAEYEEQASQLGAQVTELFRMLKEASGATVQGNDLVASGDRQSLVANLERQMQRKQAITKLKGRGN